MKRCNYPPDAVRKQSMVSDNGFLVRQQKTIACLAKFFLKGEEAERSYNLLSGLVRNDLNVDGCLILERIPESDQIRLYSGCGFCELDQLETTDWIANNYLQKTLEQDKILQVQDFQKNTEFSPPDQDCFRDFRSAMSVRIPGENQARGLLAVFDRRPRVYKPEEHAFLETIAHMLAGALARNAKDRELKRSELRSKAILDTAVDGIFTTNKTGQITLFNQAAQQIFGYHEQEILGKNVRVLMSEPYRSEQDRYFQKNRSSSNKKSMGKGREVTGLRKDGTTFPLYLAVSEFCVSGKSHFTGIVRDISEQRRLELELLKISDHERRRIGQDLHDGLGQMLTGIGLLSQDLRNKLVKEQSANADQASEIMELIKEADQYARNLSRGLLPVDFDNRGLVTSMERLAQNAERLFGITCTFQEDNAPDFYDNSLVEQLFRIAQEAISNAVKHGLADRVAVQLTGTGDDATLKITDNGKGIDKNWKNSKGSGMDIMQFRAQLIGANLEIRNRKNGGVALVCVVPASESQFKLIENR